MKALLFLIVIGSGLLNAQNDSKEFLFHKKWNAMGNTWEERWENTLAEVDSLPLPERFEILGRAARLNEQSIIQPATERQLRFSNLAIKRLITIPGHAEYFGKKVWDAYETFRGGYDKGKGGLYYTLFDNESREALKTLSLLPSVETVRVLGGMLEEEWKWPDYDTEGQEFPYHATLDLRALSAISKLPIANKPSEPLLHSEHMRQNIGVWREWYAEIESGRRTFRFIGDDTEYDLRGPVRRGGTMGERSAKRPEAVTPDDVKAAEPAPKPIRFLPYLLGLIFLLAGVSVYLKAKRNV